MSAPLIFLTALQHCFLTACIAFFDLGRLLLLAAHLRAVLTAENLFLRKQLALFQERKVKPHRADDSTRWIMATLSGMVNWLIVSRCCWPKQPSTEISRSRNESKGRCIREA